jgi:hypothetical protein
VRRRYYLTPGQVNGADALSECAAGFHMASLWEIRDTSSLRYDTDLGITSPDSGKGPPAEIGWIRTGNDNAIPDLCMANCLYWTSADSGWHGSTLGLMSAWDLTNYKAMYSWGWWGSAETCDELHRVWCVQDD